jgi:hypothetical protein
MSIVFTDSNGYLRTQSGNSPFGGILLRSSVQRNTGLPAALIVDPRANPTDGGIESNALLAVRGGNYSGIPLTSALVFASDFQEPTAGAVNYERMAVYAQCMTQDSSASANKDAVGVDARGVVYPNNPHGRVWGLFAAGATYDSSCDGRLCAVEAEVLNHALVDEPMFDQIKSKLGVHIVAAGSQLSSAAIVFTSSSQKFHKGLVCRAAAIVPLGTDANASFIELLDSGSNARFFAVDPLGRICQLKSTPTSQAFGAIVSDGITGVLTLTGTIASGAENSATVVSNSYVSATSQIFTQLAPGCTNASGSAVNVQVSAQSAGSFTLRLINGSATSTGACTLAINYWVINQ